MKYERKLAGLSQSFVANRAGLDRAKLSEAESGYTKLTANEREAVRNILLDALRKRHAEIGKILDANPV